MKYRENLSGAMAYRSAVLDSLFDMEARSGLSAYPHYGLHADSGEADAADPKLGMDEAKDMAQSVPESPVCEPHQEQDVAFMHLIDETEEALRQWNEKVSAMTEEERSALLHRESRTFLDACRWSDHQSFLANLGTADAQRG